MKTLTAFVIAIGFALSVTCLAVPAEAHGHGHHGHHGHRGHHGHPCKWRNIRVGHHWVAQNNCVGTWRTLHY